MEFKPQRSYRALLVEDNQGDVALVRRALSLSKDAPAFELTVADSFAAGVELYE